LNMKPYHLPPIIWKMGQTEKEKKGGMNVVKIKEDRLNDHVTLPWRWTWKKKKSTWWIDAFPSRMSSSLFFLFLGEEDESAAVHLVARFQSPHIPAETISSLPGRRIRERNVIIWVVVRW
jgi:hypothetical protein